jgi:hypothetical protein
MLKILRCSIRENHLKVFISCPNAHEKFKFTILDRYRHKLQTYVKDQDQHVYTFRFPCNDQAADFMQRVKGK